MKFYNREQEIKELQEAISLSKNVGAQFTVIIGPRRIGKSSLIKNVFKEKKHFYFFVSKKKSALLLNEFGEILNHAQGDNRAYQSWEEFLEQLFLYCMKEKISIVFDEFQDFYKTDPAIFSIMQKLWDKYQDQKSLNIVVAGSVITLLEKIFYSQKEPLYQRATKKIFLKEFHFSVVEQILQDHRKKDLELEELLEFYGIFGGNPYFYQQIFKADLFQKNVVEILDRLVFSPNAILKNEGREFLIQEFGKEHDSYFAILESIALNYSTFSRVLHHTKLEESVLVRNLKKLENDFSLVRKLKPVFPNNQKTFKYQINNNFLRFWFRYVYHNQSLVEAGVTKEILKNIKLGLSSLSGLSFEKYCLEYLLEHNYFEDISKFGSWWDRFGEVDLVLVSKKNKKVLIGECKLNAREVNMRQVEKMRQNVSRMNIGSHKKELFFFCAQRVDGNTKLKLKKENVVVLDDIFIKDNSTYG